MSSFVSGNNMGFNMPQSTGGYGGGSPMFYLDLAKKQFEKGEDERQRKMVQDSMTQFLRPSGHEMFFDPQTRKVVDVGGEHLLRAIGQDDLAARQAELFNYQNVMNAAKGIRQAGEQGADELRTAGVADLARTKQYGDEAVSIADKSFLDVQKQFGDAQKKYDRDIAKAYATQQQAIAQSGRSAELQQSAVAGAIAQQQSERRDQMAAQMGGAIPGTSGQFEDASRQMQAEADRLKFKSLTDIAVERDRTISSLQQNLGAMQQRGAEFGAGLAQTGASFSMQSAQQKQAARQMAAGLYSASAQQQAQAAQVSAQMRMAGRQTEAQFIAARPFHPVSMLQTYIAAMNAKKTMPQNIYGGFGGGAVTAPMEGMPIGGYPGSSFNSSGAAAERRQASSQQSNQRNTQNSSPTRMPAPSQQPMPGQLPGQGNTNPNIVYS